MKNSENAIDEENELPKLPFKRLAYALKQIVDVGIPIHVQLLKEQLGNIEKYQSEKRELELRSEQVRAANTVKLLKADLYELEQLNRQVREEDSELFQKHIRNATQNVVEILTTFMELHADVLSPFPETDPEEEVSDIFPPLVCDSSNIRDQSDEVKVAAEDQLQLQEVDDSRKKFEFVEFLQKEILEVNALIKQFSNFVFRHKDSLDTIEANVEQTAGNVSLGAQYLKKASDYKAATLPIAGAVVGALVLGPVGAIAGFKIFGSLACLAGGSVIGYGAGLKLKKNKIRANEFEMKALPYPSKSRSLPDLSMEDLKKDS